MPDRAKEIMGTKLKGTSGTNKKKTAKEGQSREPKGRSSRVSTAAEEGD